ncbi:MAG: sulfotransferase, partial [Candidatus Aenigmatarchaeota archaeon]
MDENMKNNKKDLIFIAGTPYSGSTVLCSLLGTLNDIEILGEVDRYLPFQFYPSNPEHYLTHCSICISNELYSCPIWKEEYITQYSNKKLSNEEKKELYIKILNSSSKPIVLDASKNIDWLIFLLEELKITINVKVIITVRSVYNFVVSNRKRLPQFNVVWHAEGWRNTYIHILRTCNRLKIPTLVVRNEDLILNPEEYFDKITYFIYNEKRELNIDLLYANEIHILGGNLFEFFKYPNYNLNRILNLNVEDSKLLKERLENEPEISKKTLRKNSVYSFKKLTPREFSYISQTPGVLDLLSFFGY